MFRGVSNRRIIPYTRRVTDIGGKNALSYNLASYTNASPRYFFAKNPSTGLYEMTGPFAGGTLATRNIGGKRYALIEKAFSTVNTYSEVFRAAISDWENEDCDVTDNAVNSPLGVATADKVYENTATATHYVYQFFSTDGSSRYFAGFFVQANGRTRCRLRLGSAAFVGLPTCFFNLTTGLPYDNTDCDYYGILPLENDWYYVYIAATSDVVTNGVAYFNLVIDTDQIDYEGDGNSGVNLWGAYVVKADILPSYIQAAATVATKNKDQLYWAEADVPSWIRSGFNCSMIMRSTDEMLASDGGEHVIAAYDTTGAKGVVELYFDGADKKIKWRDDDTGALGESAALDFTISNKIDLGWTLDNGSNSTLKVDGGGVDTTYNGTQTAAADGNLWGGMDDSGALQLDIAYLSQLEPL